MKTFFIALVAGHGLVHTISFLRAFDLLKGKGYSLSVSKPLGLAWLLGFLLFEITAVMLLMGNQQWWIPGIIGVLVSQALIIRFWEDKKYGTLVNIVILFVIVVDFGSAQFRKSFEGTAHHPVKTEAIAVKPDRIIHLLV